ncbi:prolyl-tRNA editing enzyme YbaK/EbsC (Cys-tRNA(Pro) deacylase) [Tamaricihabitans halophyticus]|uniref:Prolyl-tRNA editing enzyme YbaK/EbsC (Cys-tRNA(Pro) deacylase) n=1 Tax=Tamaricihabitans halophyticus TaxID=1262583 RepID=A0A4R2R0Q4_9PSEU|nr:YbaK/EbsC family protein [Tamaricihabitans halophyticus]TCP55149.1 prolyl-tRNA editing enzyme YbaK/EbsC (Cys-tRNA(Pro) deacylase) [Tamaricihabitans halophyticus]
MSSLDHPAVTQVVAKLRAAGQHRAADGVQVLPDDVRTAAKAAAAVGVPVGAIANSLIFRAHAGGVDFPLLVLTSGAHRADTGRLRALVDAESIRKADPEFVRAHTGQSIGGVAPVGHPTPVRTLVDATLADYALIWAAAGHPKTVYPTTYAELCTLTGGTAANVAAVEENAAP